MPGAGLRGPRESWPRSRRVTCHAVTSLRSFRRAATLSGALFIAGMGFSGVATAQDPYAVPPALLSTNCSIDQLMAATKVANPVTYGELVAKYNSEPPWLQGTIINHLNMLMAKTPEQRQAEVDTLATIFPAYVPLFRTAEPMANDIAAQCPTFPVVDPGVWNPNAAPPPPPPPPAG